MSETIDQNKRHFLGMATAATGLVGVGFATVPFLSLLNQVLSELGALGAPS